MLVQLIQVPPLYVLLSLGVVVIAVLVLIVFAGLIWIVKLYWDEKTDPLRHLRGLEAPFFEPLCGCVLSAKPSQHNEWVKNLGHTFRFNGFGKFDYRLVTTDIRSLTHILNSPIYEKPWQTQRVLSSFLGRGISVMEGAEHARQRKIVAPAFSAHNVRRLYAPMFIEKAAEKLCDTWHTSIVDTHEPTKVDVAHWFGRATLDVVGLASFDHSFNAIKHENEEIYLAYKRMFEQINRGPTLRFLLEVQMPWLGRIWPSELYKTIQDNMRVIYLFGRTVVHTRHRLASPDTFYSSNSKKSTPNTDLLSRLIDANTNPALHPSQRLTDQELLDQINTFLFGGSDSTGLAMAWCLHFLSCHLSLQTRLRDELLSLRDIPDMAERAHQIDGLPFLDSVVKETLRLCPPVHSTIRVATQDDVIPLSQPLILRDGKVTGEVKIRRGTFVHIPLEGFNVSTDIWGPDAVVFNPDRWYNLPTAAKSHPGLAGLLTFSFGGHACPGWKFAIMETKVFVASLVSQFIFSPSDEIERNNVIMQRPYVKDEWERGPRLPLNVQLYAA